MVMVIIWSNNMDSYIPAGNFSSVYDWPLMAMFGIVDVKQRCSTATFQTYIVGIIDGICPLFPTMILAVFDR